MIEVQILDPVAGTRTTELDADNLLWELQKEVGGLIEVVRLQAPSSYILIVNEEGLLKRLPINPVASAAAGKVIVGVAVLVDKKHFN